MCCLNGLQKLVFASQRTHTVCTKKNLLINADREIPFYCENHEKHVIVLLEQNTDLWNIEPRGAYINKWFLNGKNYAEFFRLSDILLATRLQRSCRYSWN
jgi:hypothetical protein